MLKVVVAEDDPVTLHLIEYKLEQSGFQVVSATDGEAAWDLVQKERPDLVIVDGMMPVMDGLEVVRRIRESAEWSDLPVIMLTARGRDEDIVTGLEIGASDYIVKPFSPVELIARVRKILPLPKKTALP